MLNATNNMILMEWKKIYSIKKHFPIYIYISIFFSNTNMAKMR